MPAPPPEPLAPASSYVSAARCDGPQLGGTPDPTIKVDLIGNSSAHEVEGCLGQILTDRKHATVNIITQSAFAFCELFVAPSGGIVSTRMQPDADLVIIYGMRGTGRVDTAPCMQRNGQPPLFQWVNDAHEIVKKYLDAPGVSSTLKILLVPQPVPAGQRGVDPSSTGYVNIAKQHPGRVFVGDVGKFARQGNLWTWRAVCGGGEVGCEADGAITIRLKADGGKHFCKVVVAGGVCPDGSAGGVRRASSSIAVTALSLLP